MKQAMSVASATRPTAEAKSPEDKTPSLSAIQRKLDRWELLHLRQHAIDLFERLQLAEQTLDSAQSQADYWREQCFDLMQDLQNNGETLGMTKSGQIGVMA